PQPGGHPAGAARGARHPDPVRRDPRAAPAAGAGARTAARRGRGGRGRPGGARGPRGGPRRGGGEGPPGAGGDRAARAAAGARAPVVLVAAGWRGRRANEVIARIARRWARERGWWAVAPAYASAAGPRPGTAVARLLRAGAPRVVVAPYLLAPGYFADR